jgi:toxin-antitoxin system PIN domain toxin
MIAVDTNLLVYAHREDSPWHKMAVDRLSELADSGAPWAIPWPCVHEFLAIVTHPKIYNPPTPLATALAALEAWQSSPGLRFLSEGPGYWKVIAELTSHGMIKGPKIHDARIAAICLHHQVKKLWSADRDFSSFPMLVCENPLVRPGK